MKTIAAIVLLSIALGPAPLLAQELPAGITTQKTSAGTVLADDKGMTLYIFDEDKKNSSTCYDKCLELWPVFIAKPDAQTGNGFTMIQRKDGVWQWAYKGKPLYLASKDKKPGDVKGDGFRDTWHVAEP
jgi:predicted lipoprotein with Yx(FWY)xxD motif